MTDPLRTDRPPAPGEVPERDRDARVEELLLAGLDHYFLAQYELAISVWTRVLFLDRGHARARAYIERARSALAERQRESEELLHTGAAAFDRGDAGAARRLLTSALERGAASEEAVALLERLDRLENATAVTVPAGPQRRAGAAAPGEIPTRPEPAAGSRLTWVATGVIAGLAVAGAAAWLWTAPTTWWRAARPAPPAAAIQPRPEPLPLPSSAEAALTRAERLYAGGRLHDALDVLDGIRRGDALRPRADELRGRIQRELLDSARMPEAAATALPARELPPPRRTPDE